MGSAELIAVAAVCVAFASLVVAVFTTGVSIGIAVWQGWETRRHNRKSVQPHLTRYVSGGPDNPSDFPFGFTVRNDGSGPAIIDAIESTLDGKPYSGHWTKLWDEAGCGGSQFSVAGFEVGDHLRPGSIFQFVSIITGQPNFEQRRAFVEALMRIDFRIDYRSVYGDKKSLYFGGKTIEVDLADKR